MNEFDLVKNFFEPMCLKNTDVLQGIGDDGAVIKWLGTSSLVMATDTLVAGVHFPHDMAPEAIGYRSGAVNISDIAAMGGLPKYATLALTIPRVDEKWLSQFSNGLRQVFSEFGCSLVGGDTTKGPLTVNLTLIGAMEGPCLRRSGCEQGDVVLVSGTLGDARGALDLLGSNKLSEGGKYLLKRFQKPEARVALGISLVGYANACIDISDGLLADLKHLSDASEKAIIVDIDKLPISDALLEVVGRERAVEYATTGGDDYELAFTVSPSNVDYVMRVAAQHEQRISVIGEVQKGSGVRFKKGQERGELLEASGYRHF
jgi:thiamine-monophosphate kinase